MTKWPVCLWVLAILLALPNIADSRGKNLVKIGSDVVVNPGQKVTDAVSIGGDVTAAWRANR